MIRRSCALLLAAVLAAAVPATTLAAQTPVMTFEEFANGATNVDGFYDAGISWLNEEVFNTLATPAQSPFPGPNALTRATCGVTACELELLSLSAIESITLSGLISGGPDLAILVFNSANQQVGAFVIDTELQSVGCVIVTDWSCNRSFDFTQLQDIHRLQFITSGMAVIDNVQVTTFTTDNGGGTVPEPASIALVFIGLLGVAASRRRSSTKSVARISPAVSSARGQNLQLPSNSASFR